MKYVAKSGQQLSVCDVPPGVDPWFSSMPTTHQPETAAGFTLQMDRAIFTWVTGAEL